MLIRLGVFGWCGLGCLLLCLCFGGLVFVLGLCFDWFRVVWCGLFVCFVVVASCLAWLLFFRMLLRGFASGLFADWCLCLCCV